MRFIPALLLFLLVGPHQAPAQGAVLIETAAGPVVFDPWVWESRGRLPVTGTVNCQSSDGSGIWVVDPANPHNVNFWPLKTARPEPLSLTLSGGCVALAADPKGDRLWLAMVDSKGVTGQAHSYVALASPGAASPTARLDLFGLPQSMLLLPAEPPRHEQLLITAWIPELNLGMLYTLDPSLTRVVQSAPMPGRPLSIRHAHLPPPESTTSSAPDAQSLTTPAETGVDLDAAGGTLAARTPAVASATTPSAHVADAAAATAPARASKGFKSPVALLKGRMTGQVLDAKQRGVVGATVTVKNRRGKTWKAVSDAEGTWRLESLPFGTYQVSAKLDGRPEAKADDVMLLENERSVIITLKEAE